MNTPNITNKLKQQLKESTGLDGSDIDTLFNAASDLGWELKKLRTPITGYEKHVVKNMYGIDIELYGNLPTRTINFVVPPKKVEEKWNAVTRGKEVGVPDIPPPHIRHVYTPPDENLNWNIFTILTMDNGATFNYTQAFERAQVFTDESFEGNWAEYDLSGYEEFTDKAAIFYIDNDGDENEFEIHNTLFYLANHFIPEEWRLWDRGHIPKSISKEKK